MGRDRLRRVAPALFHRISIHAPRVGRDLPARHVRAAIQHFNPRAPCGARPTSCTARSDSWHFNPRAPCGARRESESALVQRVIISIHAPRVGRDLRRVAPALFHRISIHAPRVGRDYFAEWAASYAAKFQSTRPVWGATLRVGAVGLRRGDFNPRAPCGARRAGRGSARKKFLFQSTRPVWGATPSASCRTTSSALFQSTRPVWGATADRIINTG